MRQAREAAEHEADRQHPDIHHAFLQLAGMAFQLRQAVFNWSSLFISKWSPNKLSIDWVITNSPTILIKVSILAVSTRIELEPLPAALASSF